MSKEIASLEPRLLWKQFLAICSIPHPSKHEEKIIAYVQQFAKEQGLAFSTDEAGNIVIRKPATKGMEHCKTIVLQSHLDMVPQKNQGIEHDFTKDPIRPRIVDGWVMATDTTLGADNGIGAAAMLALLESKEIVHGPIEALFTIDEETGLTGAFSLKPGFVTGDILLNTDTEDEGHFCIGCAGGINTNATITIQREKITGHRFFQIQLKGLKGGHSGADIHLYRGNANKLMNRLLYDLSVKVEARIATFNGGNVRNAIPREAFAVIAVPTDKEKEYTQCIQGFRKEISNEYAIAEPDFTIDSATANEAEVMDLQSQNKLLNTIYALPNGVIRMSDEVKGIVETSTNLSVVRTNENSIEIQSLTRSSIETAKEDAVKMLQSVYELSNASVVHEGSYPGWKPNSHSSILTLMQDVYKRTFSKDAIVEVVHAGLECGIIGGVYPQMDMISFGPTIRFPHSPDEKVEIESVAKFWNLLIQVLKEVPKK